MEKMTTQFSWAKIHVPSLRTFELHYPQAVVKLSPLHIPKEAQPRIS